MNAFEIPIYAKSKDLWFYKKTVIIVVEDDDTLEKAINKALTLAGELMSGTPVATIKDQIMAVELITL